MKSEEERVYKVGDCLLAKTKGMTGKHQLWILYATTKGALWKNAGGTLVPFTELIEIKEVE